MFCKRIWTSIILLASFFLLNNCGSIHHTNNERVASFISATQSYPIFSKDSLLAIEEALFQCIPVMDSTEKEYVLVFDSLCSSCIAKALDCYSAYLLLEEASAFVFMSKAINTELFQYYFQKEFPTNPPCYYSPELSSVPEGLYVLKGQRVLSFTRFDSIGTIP